MDILGGVSELAHIDARAGAPESLGHEATGMNGMKGRPFFGKIDRSGRRTRSLHAFARRAPVIERHLAFRDHLRHDADVAA